MRSHQKPLTSIVLQHRSDEWEPRHALGRCAAMRTSRPSAIVIILLAWVSIACSNPALPSAPQDAAPLKLPDAVLQPGEGLGFEPDPVGTPEENPKLWLHVAPIDESTGELVTVPVTVLLDGRALGVGLSEYTFALPGVMEEHRELVVEAPGYQPWSLVLHYELTNTRLWHVPVVLKPLRVLRITPGRL